MFVYNFNKIITINCLQTIKILYLHFLGNAKDTPNRSASRKYIIRSFVNGGADLSGGSLSTCIRSFRPVGLFYGGPQRNFCRYGILSLYSLDRGDTRAFSGV